MAAIGYLGFSREDYNRLELRDFDLKIKAYEETMKSERFDSWEQARFIALASCSSEKHARSINRWPNPYGPKKEKTKSMPKSELLKRIAERDLKRKEIGKLKV